MCLGGSDGARGTISILMAIARESARQQRLSESARNRQVRAATRQAQQTQRALSRFEKEAAREAKAQYQRDREQETFDLNSALQQRLEGLRGILAHTLSVDDTIVFDTLRIREARPKFSPPDYLRQSKPSPSKSLYLDTIAPPAGLKALIPGAKRRYQQLIESAASRYEADLLGWMNEEQERLEQLTNLELKFAEVVESFDRKRAQRDSEVDLFERDYHAGDPDAIIAYCSMVLERSPYPEGVPHNFSIAYTTASKQLVIECELPVASIIPTESEFRYVKSTDMITEKPRKESEIRSLYQDIVASIALRTIHEVFEADQSNHVTVICFNGYVHTIDPATGKDIQPHLISVRTTTEKFQEIDLSRVDKAICLKNLGAQVSRHASEAQPVKPIVEFEMADARFVDQTDLVSGLSSAANLMDLNPYEFEQLVANLFGRMDLESKLTRSSRDGGVDCVAYDARPVLGGKVVIQAKRYRHTVGVSAVRDLYGTMMNEGANKGILVTTSGYGPDAFGFAKDKPIELIDGGALLYLLRETGFEARIVFPETD